MSKQANYPTFSNFSLLGGLCWVSKCPVVRVLKQKLVLAHTVGFDWGCQGVGGGPHL